MEEKPGSEHTNQLADLLAGGRTVDEQVEWLRKYGNHGVPTILRSFLLNAIGVPPPREGAENAIILGCYIPFASPSLVHTIINLLGRLGISYTTLEQEYCCGAPLVMKKMDDRGEEMTIASREINQRNVAQADRKGARNLAYLCVGCAHTAKNLFPDATEHHQYIYDLIADRMEKEDPKVPPTTLGYFEGCHSDYKIHYPHINLNWERYRRLLDRIEGLRVLDLPNAMCCKKASGKIIENAEKLQVDTILCSCNGCYGFLGGMIGGATQGKIRVLSFPELLLQALPKD